MVPTAHEASTVAPAEEEENGVSGEHYHVHAIGSSSSSSSSDGAHAL